MTSFGYPQPSLLGENVTLRLQLEDGTQFESTDNITQLTERKESNEVTNRTLGSTLTLTEVRYGRYDLSWQVEQNGSDYDRLRDRFELEQKQGRVTTKAIITVIKDDVQGTGQRVDRYKRCSIDINEISTGSAEDKVSISISAKAMERDTDSSIPPKTPV